MAPSANFSNIYKFYDLINKILTLGFDTKWRLKAANFLVGNEVLDLGSGTGASYKVLNYLNVTAFDPNVDMLKLNKFSNKIVGYSENLPFENNSFDSVYSSFVWRNVSNADKSLEEVHRVLKENGVFVLLDMTRPNNSFLKSIHKIGTFIVTNFIGVITFNLKEYKFLHNSLDKYPQPEIHLSNSPFSKFKIKRMGLFNFVYICIFTK